MMQGSRGRLSLHQEKEVCVNAGREGQGSGERGNLIDKCTGDDGLGTRGCAAVCVHSHGNARLSPDVAIGRCIQCLAAAIKSQHARSVGSRSRALGQHGVDRP